MFYKNYFNAVADRNWEELKAVSSDDMILWSCME